MSEAVDRISEAIYNRSGELRNEVLASVTINLPPQEAQRMGGRFMDKEFHTELEKKIRDILQWISPGCRVTFPGLLAGTGKCFTIKRDAPGCVMDFLQAEAFAFPQKDSKD